MVALSTLLVHLLTEILADFKKGKFFGAYLDFLAGFWITAFIGTVIFNNEASKSPNFNAFPPSESLRHGVDNRIGYGSRLSMWYSNILCQGFNKL